MGTTVCCCDCGTVRLLGQPCPACGRYGEVLPEDVTAAGVADEPVTVDVKEND